MEIDPNTNGWRKSVYKLSFTALLLGILTYGWFLAAQVADLVVAFAIALLINYLLKTPVEWLTKFVKVRVISVFIIFLLFILSLFLLGLAIFPELAYQLKQLKIALPVLVCNIDNALIEANIFLSQYSISLPLDEFNQEELLTTIAGALPKINYTNLGSVIGNVLLNSVSTILYSVLTLILSFYLLVDGQRVWDTFLVPFSDRFAMHLNEIKLKVDTSLEAYVIGQFKVAFLTSTVMFFTYIFLGSPYAIVFALFQMLEIIPVFGTWVAIVSSVLILAFTSGYTAAIIAIIVYLVYSQAVRDNFVAPRIMGDALGFHPIGVIMGLILGAKLGGMAGVVLALPLLAVITAIIDHFVEFNRLSVKTTRTN